MMFRNVYNKYCNHLQTMRHNHDPRKIERLEEQRIRLHNRLLDMLEAYGIPYTDRDDAVDLACRYLKTH